MKTLPRPSLQTIIGGDDGFTFPVDTWALELLWEAFNQMLEAELQRSLLGGQQ
jgi:hypothetical protein